MSHKSKEKAGKVPKMFNVIAVKNWIRNPPDNPSCRTVYLREATEDQAIIRFFLEKFGRQYSQALFSFRLRNNGTFDMQYQDHNVVNLGPDWTNNQIKLQMYIFLCFYGTIRYYFADQPTPAPAIREQILHGELEYFRTFCDDRELPVPNLTITHDAVDRSNVTTQDPRFNMHSRALLDHVLQAPYNVNGILHL